MLEKKNQSKNTEKKLNRQNKTKGLNLMKQLTKIKNKT